MNERKLKQQTSLSVREACLMAAQKAYESAGISGLCEEGRWECAVSAIRSLDLEAIIDSTSDKPGK